jgi:hypothetical protein
MTAEAQYCHLNSLTRFTRSLTLQQRAGRLSGNNSGGLLVSHNFCEPGEGAWLALLAR